MVNEEDEVGWFCGGRKDEVGWLLLLLLRVLADCCI
jgi:hypothetical protein